MALAIVQTIIAEGSGQAVTTASYNITAGNNCVLLGASNGHTSPVAVHTVTGTPAFTKQVERNGGDGGQEGGASAHTHMNSAGHSGITSTLTKTTDAGNPDLSCTVTELSGGETSFTGAVGENSNISGTPSVTFTLNGSASYVFGTASDWNASADFTAGTDETLLNTHHVGGVYSGGQWRSTSTQGAGSYTSDGAGSATRRYNIVAIEMRESAGAAAVPDPGFRRRALPPNMRRGPRVFRAFVDAILTPGPVGSGELLLQSVDCLSDVANVTVAVPAPLTLGTVPCLSNLPNMTVATPARLTLGQVDTLSNLPNVTVATPAPLTLGTVPCVSDLGNVVLATPARLALDTVPCVSSLGNVALATPAPLTLGAVPTLSDVANVAVATPAGLTLQAVACTSSLANITITTDPPPPAVGSGFTLFKAAASG